MDSSSITGTGVLSPGFTSISNRPVKSELETQQYNRPISERIPEENKGNRIDITA